MYAKNPAKLIQKAQIIGLRALVDLLRARVTMDTRTNYTRAHERLANALVAWRESKTVGQPDFSVIVREEKYLRNFELQNIWETTARYGNSERKRIKDEVSEPVGPLNTLLNVLGARLRDYFLLMYPFEEAAITGRKGNRVIWGILGDRKTGNIPVAHGPRLVELDFADMIRSHGREAARISFISGVPLSEFDNYILLLIRRLSPFLDYLYTDGDVGRRGFGRLRRKNIKRNMRPSADEILRGITSEIEAVYGTKTSGSMTSLLSPSEPDTSPSNLFFEKQIAELRNPDAALSMDETAQRQEWAIYLETLLTGKRPRLRVKDAVHLLETIRNDARWEGIKYHGLLFDGQLQPYNLRSLVLDGAASLQVEDNSLIATEVPIDTQEGPGRADICIFNRTTISNPKRPGITTVLKPVGVFDVKTRTAFNWFIGAKKKRDSSASSVVKTIPNFIVDMRALTQQEWQWAMSETPSRSDSQQLNRYETGLLEGYREATGDESCKSILKGIVLADSVFDIELARSILPLLIDKARNESIVREDAPGATRQLVEVSQPQNMHIAVVLDRPTVDELKAFRPQRQQEHEPSTYDPFSNATTVNGQHIVYISVDSNATSGFTASRIAEFWHGMQLVKDLAERKNTSRVLWLDLAGLLSHKPLAQTRLRLDEQDAPIRAFFDSVEVLDLSAYVDGYLFKGEDVPDLRSIASVKASERDSVLIVVSGWEWVENSTPSRLGAALSELERFLVEESNRYGGTVLWFCKPRPAEQTSWKYHRRAALPFWDSSPHARYVTDIIWNLPTRAYTPTQRTPMLDELRVIIKLTKDTVDAELVEIPTLSGWSERFWSKPRIARKGEQNEGRNRGRAPLTASDILQNTALTEQLIQESAELVPWLFTLRPERFAKPKAISIIEEAKIRSTPLPDDCPEPSGVTSRVKFRAPSVGSRFGRSHVPVTNELPTITNARRYRRNVLKSSRNAQSYRAPDAGLLRASGYLETRANRVEIRRLKKAVQFLSKEMPDRAWQSFISELSSVIPEKPDDATLNALNRIAYVLRSSSTSKALWDRLLWLRESRLGDGLRSQEKEAFDRFAGSSPHLLTLYGSYLLLILLAVSRRFSGLSEDQTADLWECMKSWELTQLGFRIETQQAKALSPKFDVRAVWANLCKRAETLSRMPQPAQTSVRFGLLLMPSENDYSVCWLFLEDEYDSRDLIGGLWTGRSPVSVTGSFEWCETSHDVIAINAESVENLVAHDIVAARMQGIDCMWLKDNDGWRLLGAVKIIRRAREAITRIRGIEIEPVEMEELQRPPEGITFPSDLRARVMRELQIVSNIHEDITRVKCSLATDSNMYVISFQAEGTKVDDRRLAQTSDLLTLLRLPLAQGLPLRNSKKPKQFLTWDPYTDIEYGELQLLRPYVERKTPYVQVESRLPATCEQLIQRTSESMSLVVSHDKTLCPMVSGTGSSHGACWRVRRQEDSGKTLPQWLPSGGLSDSEIASLLSSREVFTEQARYILSIKTKPSASSRDGIVFRESSIMAKVLGVKPVPLGTFLRMNEEKLAPSVTRVRGEIQISLYSTVTEERVSSATLIPPEGRWAVEEIVESLAGDLAEFVREYSGKRSSSEEMVVDYERLLQEVREILRQISRARRS